jgi:hypothetical protein
MKTNLSLRKVSVLVATFAVVSASVLLFTAGKPAGKLIAHEWGTFTSVQGSDGVLLDWRPLESSKLPGFVYNWKNPGLNRVSVSAYSLAKSSMLTLQRMETPVIYFYSDKEQTVDVSVNFPKGTITEWYPQACQIGPSITPVPPAIATLDGYAHKAGISPTFSFNSLLGHKNVKESRALWANVRILPAKSRGTLALPTDKSGSHYFAARETDSALLQISSLTPTNPAPENEKFIFYRGAGSFATPLQVAMTSPDEVTVINNSKETLHDLFVLGVQNHAGHFLHVDSVPAGGKKIVSLKTQSSIPLEKLTTGISTELAKSLVKAGLYRREATAMVKTWEDSWFAEEGLRVLYILPRAWTDETLPLNIDPAPRELVRVMVGRAEVLTAKVTQDLADSILKAKEGDNEARARVLSQFQKLGRFGEPALRLATKNASNELKQSAWTLLQAAADPKTTTPSL